MEMEVEKERHPFRFLFRFAVFAGILYAAGRFLVSKKDEYYGISESEAREKMESKLGSRIGEDKAAEIADQVIPVLKEKGFIKSDAEAAADAVKDAAEKATEKVKETADKAGDKAKNAADKVAEAVDDMKS